MRFRFRYLTGPVHTELRLFAGPSEPKTTTLAKCGDLVMRNEEFIEFREAIECTFDGCYPQFEFVDENEEHSTLTPR